MQLYANFLRLAVNAEVDLDDGMIYTLHGSGYALNRATDAYASAATNELATGGGYTAGGTSAGVVSRTTTVANSWATQRANAGTYAVGDVVRPAAANGFLYRAAAVSGVTGGAPPAFPTAIGLTVVDGGVTWVCYGIAITVLTSANPPSWPGFSATGIRYLVLADRSSGVAATSPLVSVTDFGSDQSGTGQAWTVTPHPTLGLAHFIHQ
jgi:hypothetical protein